MIYKIVLFYEIRGIKSMIILELLRAKFVLLEN